jgi:hypothetical protein
MQMRTNSGLDHDLPAPEVMALPVASAPGWSPMGASRKRLHQSSGGGSSGIGSGSPGTPTAPHPVLLLHSRSSGAMLSGLRGGSRVPRECARPGAAPLAAQRDRS